MGKVIQYDDLLTEITAKRIGNEISGKKRKIYFVVEQALLRWLENDILRLSAGEIRVP